MGGCELGLRACAGAAFHFALAGTDQKQNSTCILLLVLLLLQMLIATTGNGWLVPLLITGSVQEGGIQAAPLPGTSSEQPINFACWYRSGVTDPASGITNTGGTGESLTT